jgi:hypothetical protein
VVRTMGLILAVAGLFGASGATAKPSGPVAARVAAALPDVGPVAAGDEVVTGVGDTRGYHVYAASSGGGWAWRPLATVQPGGYSDERWIGRQCLTGDGRQVVAVVAPWHAANSPDGMDAGGYAYAIDAHTGAVRPLAAGVSLAYFDPGCGADGRAVLTRYTARDEGATQLLSVDTDTEAVTASPRIDGELTSAVPVGGATVAVRGDSVVRLSGGAEQRMADLPGQPFDLRPNASGGVDLLVRENSTTAGLWRLDASGAASRLGSGALVGAALYGGRGGRTMAAGVALRPGVRGGPAVLRAAAEAVSEDGTTQVRASARSGPAPVAQDRSAGATELRAADSGRVLASSVPPPGPTVTRVVPDYVGSVRSSAAEAAATQSPACAVPRDDVTLQVPQPGAAQIDWAAQQAARGQLTALRPDGAWGLPASAPSSDFPLPAPFGGVIHPVPREVVEAVMAQESNWSQASWHALPGLAGNPLIADYYGYNASGTIDYGLADCGYGVGQITSIMTVGATDPYTGLAVPNTIQKKVAVDYAENAAATAYFLAHKWNDVTGAGIIANNGDPSMLENWYFAIWAYNTGLHAYSSTQPWGLGWLNNPINPIYPATRNPFLQTSYGDASHPGDWPYQERVMGWMNVPLGGDSPDYARSARYPILPTDIMFCSTAVNQCDPLDPNKVYCQRSDYECWWHANQAWVSSCASVCTAGFFTLNPAAAEPSAPADPHPPVCSSTLPGNAIIVNDQPGDVNLAGCGSSNWHNAGSFQASFGTDASGDPIGVIDWHQLGAGFGGHFWFSHTRQAGEPNTVTGTWTPSSLTEGTYNVKVFVPDTGAGAVEATYTINPGNGHASVQRTIDQSTTSNAWVGLGDFTLYPGASVVLSSVTGDGNDATDIAFSATAFVPVSGTIVHHTVDAVSIFQPTQNIDTGMDSYLKSILVSQNAVTQWATGETSAAAGLPTCTGTPAGNCITAAVKSSFSTWATSIATEPTAVWLGLANPALPSPVPGGWFDDPTHYKAQTHFDVDFMLRADGSIDPGSIDVTGVNRVGDTELAPFILPFMNAVAADYAIPAPDLSYAAPNLNTYNDVSTSVDLNATGLAPGRNYMSYVEPPALADNNTCLSLAAMEGGADGYKPIVNDPGIDASTAAWVAALYTGYQNNVVPKVVWDTAANIVKAFFHPISKDLLGQVAAFISAPQIPFDPQGSIFTMAPGIWAEPHLKLCTGSTLVKPDGGTDPAGMQTTVDNSYMPDLYLLVDNKLYDAFGTKAAGPINTGDWKTFSAPPWQAAPSPTPWNTCYIGPALPLNQQTFPDAPFIARRDGNPFDIHLLQSPGESGNSVFLCDRPQEGTHYDNPQP